MHPSCAGVETGFVYGNDGTKEPVLLALEKLPRSCFKCSREMKRKNQMCLQQRPRLDRKEQFPPPCDVRRSKSPPQHGNKSSVHIYQIKNSHSILGPSSSSITRFVELGAEPLHKLEEGHDDCMVHRHKPGHELHPKDNGTIYCCSGCKMESFGLHYACGNASCSFLLHAECKSPRKFTCHQFFPMSTFAFSCLHNTSYYKHNKKVHTNVLCNACGMNVNGYYYHSLDGKNNLHPCCINLPKQIICGESGAMMVLQSKTTFECGYCHERSVEVGNESTDNVWSYAAERENYHLHIKCMINMLSDLREDSMARLISCRMTSKNGKANMNLEIALRQTMTQCERKFKIFIKYAKIVLGAIISALLGDPTTLFVHTTVALILS
ncbi:uncharacterized protein LOC144559780 [Carex rostrata]